MPNQMQINNGFPVVYEETEDVIVVQYKSERNAKLAETDVYMVEDFPTAKRAEWKAYRQSLRDMDFSNPDNITWPTKPE